MLKRCLLLFVAWGLLLNSALANDVYGDLPPVTLKTSENLAEDGRLARQRQVPLLLMFSMHHCPYCTVVEESFLKPMLRNRDYDKKVLMRKIELEGGYITDFNGQDVEVDEISNRYSVSLVPTVILVDHKGRQLAASLIGMANEHYYGGDLDAAIERSLQKIRRVALKQ